MAIASVAPTGGYAGDSPRTSTLRTAALLTGGALVSVAVPITDRMLAERAAKLSRHDTIMRCQRGLATTMPEITESPVITIPMAATISISRGGGRSRTRGGSRRSSGYPHPPQKLASGRFSCWH
jgi:hypothetical protein